MKQPTWQYKVIKLGQHWSEEYVEDKLDQAGAEGWEAVGMGRLPADQMGGGEATVLLKRERHTA